MKINSYAFGEVVVNGRKYTSDVIIFPDRVKSGWWKKRGHQVSPEDIEEVIKEKPEILVVGKGAHGLMEVLPQAKRYLEEQGVELIALPTSEACEIYNQLCLTQKVVAALHLTC